MAVILPPPAETFEKFGLDLTGYLAQPGSGFSVNRYGFDTGHRRFIVNSDVANLGDFVLGSPDFQYRQMFVHKVTNENIGGPWNLVDVEYIGLIFPNKPVEISTDADTRKTTILIGFGLISVNFQIELSEVTVQTVYIQDTQPDLNLSGSAAWQFGGGGGGLTPPIDIPPPTLESLNNILGLPPDTIRVFLWWWVLRKRSVRIAGGVDGGVTIGSPPPQRVLLNGNITLTHASRDLTATGGQFLSQLDPADIIHAVSPPITNYRGDEPPGSPHNRLFTEFAQGFSINSISGNNSALLINNYYGGDGTEIPVDFTGSFYTMTSPPPPPPPVSGSATLYEVTDSWKRLVLVYGEPLANALSQ